MILTMLETPLQFDKSGFKVQSLIIDVDGVIGWIPENREGYQIMMLKAPSFFLHFQCLSHLLSQRIQREGFLKEMYTLIEDAMMSNHIGCVTGHEQAFHVWTQEAELLPEVSAAHFRHHYVRHEQLNAFRVFTHYLESISGVGSRYDFVSQLIEKSCGESEQRFLVFYKQNGLRSSGCFGQLGFNMGDCCLRLELRQVDPEGCSLAWFAIDVDETVVLLDDTIDGGQPESRSLSQGFGGKEGDRKSVV